MMIAAVTPANYARFFTDPFYRDVLVTTIRVSACVTSPAWCSACRWPGGWRAPPAGGSRRWLMLIILPLFIGATTRTAGWMILFARGGMLDVVAGCFAPAASI